MMVWVSGRSQRGQCECRVQEDRVSVETCFATMVRVKLQLRGTSDQPGGAHHLLSRPVHRTVRSHGHKNTSSLDHRAENCKLSRINRQGLSRGSTHAKLSTKAPILQKLP
eukprot:1745795-Rhodomonas_salina.2